MPYAQLVRLERCVQMVGILIVFVADVLLHTLPWVTKVDDLVMTQGWVNTPGVFNGYCHFPDSRSPPYGTFR